MFNELETDDMSKMDELSDSVNKMADAMTQLMNGSSQLYDNLGILLKKSDALVSAIGQISAATGKLLTGAVEIYDGSLSLRDNLLKLSDGLNTLVSNNDVLNNGARTVFESLLDVANTQLSQAGLDKLGIQVPALTIDNYSKTIEQVVEKIEKLDVYHIAYESALKQVTATVNANENGIKQEVTNAARQEVTSAVTAQVQQTVTDKITAAVREQVAAQVQSQADSAYQVAAMNIIMQQLCAQGMTEEEAHVYLKTDEAKTLLSNTVKTMNDEQKASALEAAVTGNMAGKDVQNLIESNIS